MYPNGYVPQSGAEAPRRRSTTQGRPAGAGDQQAWRYAQPGQERRSPSPVYDYPAPRPRRTGQQYDAPRGVPQLAGQTGQPNHGQPGWEQQSYQNWQPARQDWGNAQPGYGGPPQGGYTPPPRPPQWQPPVPPPPHRSGRMILLVLIAIIVLVMAGVGGYFALRRHQTQQYVNAYNGLFCQGVYVDGIHLGGMTQQQGIEAVTQQAQQRSSAWQVRLMYQGNLVAAINADQLGLRTDVIDTLRAAWEQGHTGSLDQRKAAMEALANQPYEAYTAIPSGDTAVIDTVLEEIRRNVYRPAQDAVAEFDPNRTYPFVIHDEVVGRSLDTEPIKEQLYHMVSTLTSGDIEIVPTLSQPQVRAEDLQNQMALIASASTPISKDSTENRNNNIRRSFQPINGYVLQPGATFSFNGVVGQRTQKNGFFEAIEYAYGEPVMGWGGGVCQASTTLYQAAILAGLEIVKRQPHSDQVGYSEYGKDATVYWEGSRKIDLSFRNNTDSPIYMVAGVVPDPSNHKRLVAKVSFYGQSLGNVTYGLEAKTTEVLPIPAEPKYVRDKKHEYVTYKDEEKQTSKGREGYVVDSFRVKYVDGHEVERTLLYTDTYKAKPVVIYVGTEDR